MICCIVQTFIWIFTVYNLPIYGFWLTKGLKKDTVEGKFGFICFYFFCAQHFCCLLRYLHKVTDVLEKASLVSKYTNLS